MKGVTLADFINLLDDDIFVDFYDYYTEELLGEGYSHELNIKEIQFADNAVVQVTMDIQNCLSIHLNTNKFIWRKIHD